MPLLKRITRLFGDEGNDADGSAMDRETADRESVGPSHVCQSCGKEYFENPTMNIRTCGNCGGVKVERV
jgi:ribosomal protein L37AE/L43A